MDKIELTKLINFIIVNLDTQAEYKLFLYVFSKHLSKEDPVISYTQFIEDCNTNRKAIKRGLDKLLEKNYIIREPVSNSFRYSISDELLTKIKK